MNVIGAILAVLGYSINDTIVIFARIRENVKRLPGESMYNVINISITETLSRTILTTFATTLVVIAFFIFGGETLRDLSLALLIGIVFGIYSTIFIATPVLYMLYKEHKAVTSFTTFRNFKQTYTSICCNGWYSLPCAFFKENFYDERTGIKTVWSSRFTKTSS